MEFIPKETPASSAALGAQSATADSTLLGSHNSRSDNPRSIFHKEQAQLRILYDLLKDNLNRAYEVEKNPFDMPANANQESELRQYENANKKAKSEIAGSTMSAGVTNSIRMGLDGSCWRMEVEKELLTKASEINTYIVRIEDAAKKTITDGNVNATVELLRGISTLITKLKEYDESMQSHPF